ncbi:MAG: 6-bladed beta-propeller [Planctomycetes bacterium]|nr:6-bladed beta-propeller [Planctomycetota bacterium]
MGRYSFIPPRQVPHFCSGVYSIGFRLVLDPPDDVLTVLTPDGGEMYLVGTKPTILWSSTIADATVKLELSLDGGISWSTLVTTANDGEYEWDVPSVCSEECLVRISSVSQPGYADVSDGVFVIYECDLGYEYVDQWGESGTGNSQFNEPKGIAVDADGKVFVADNYNHRVQLFGADGTFVDEFGGPGSGPGQFNRPHGIAIDTSGFVFVVDANNNRVQKFEPNAISGDYDHVVDLTGGLNKPKFVAVDEDGFVYVTDTSNHRVVKFEYNDGTSSYDVVTHWGQQGSGDGEFDFPYGIAVDSDGFVYVVEHDNQRVQKFASDGTYVTQWAVTGATEGPSGIAINAAGDILVCDSWNHRVMKYSRNGSFITEWGSGPGTGDGEFNGTSGIGIDADGYIYVSDNSNHRVQKFEEGAKPLADFNGDCAVNLIDFAMFCEMWLWNGNPFGG